jgi:hypothetical protein
LLSAADDGMSMDTMYGCKASLHSSINQEFLAIKGSEAVKISLEENNTLWHT